MSASGSNIRQFGAYQLIREIGRGGMGVVYLAIDSRIGRKCALKTLLPNKATAETLQRFEREAHAMARFKHPGLVQIYEFGSYDGVPFIALEYLESGSLKDRLAKLGDIKNRVETERGEYFSSVLRWLIDIASATRALHNRGVIHRDLKPENLLLRGEQVCLSDFGLARIQDAQEQLTLTGEILGTPAYMAPEQIDHQLGKVNASTDIYAIGAIGYRMLAGQNPYSGSDALSTMRKVLKGKREPLENMVDSAVPSQLIRIIDRCLETKPADRFQNAADLLHALESCVEVGEPQQDNPKTMKLEFVVLVVLIGLAAFFSYRVTVGKQTIESLTRETRDVRQSTRSLTQQLESYAIERRKLTALRYEFDRAFKASKTGRWDDVETHRFCRSFAKKLPKLKTMIDGGANVPMGLREDYLELWLDVGELICGYSPLCLRDWSLGADYFGFVVERKSLLLNKSDWMPERAKIELTILAWRVSSKLNHNREANRLMALLGVLLKSKDPQTKTEREVFQLCSEIAAFKAKTLKEYVEDEVSSGQKEKETSRVALSHLKNTLELLATELPKPILKYAMIEAISTLYQIREVFGRENNNDLILHFVAIHQDFHKAISETLSGPLLEETLNLSIRQFSPYTRDRLAAVEWLRANFPGSAKLSELQLRVALFRRNHEYLRIPLNGLDPQFVKVVRQFVLRVRRMGDLTEWSGTHLRAWVELIQLTIYQYHRDLTPHEGLKTARTHLLTICRFLPLDKATANFVNTCSRFLGKIDEFQAKKSLTAVKRLDDWATLNLAQQAILRTHARGMTLRYQMLFDGRIPAIPAAEFRSLLVSEVLKHKEESQNVSLVVYCETRNIVPIIEMAMNLLFQFDRYRDGLGQSLDYVAAGGKINYKEEMVIKNNLIVCEFLLNELENVTKQYESSFSIQLTEMRKTLDNRRAAVAANSRRLNKLLKK